jgi:general secretion pathway protein G
VEEEHPLNPQRSRKDKGFTLIELLIVISLIGILSGILVSVINYAGVRAKMRDNTRISDLRLIQNALEQYFVDYRHYPVHSGSWFNVTATLTADLVTPNYIKALPTDPQSGDYVYKSSTSGSYYVLAGLMEVSTSNDGHECSALNSASALGTPGFGADLCYGVESPTVLH